MPAVADERSNVDLPIPVACGIVALVLALVPVSAALGTFGGHPSGLIRMSAEEPMASLATRLDPQFRFVHREAHYDGVYFYAMALDPIATGEANELIDWPAYRYGHPGYGWLAGLLSFGQPRLVPAALVALALAGIAVAGWAAAKLFTDLGASPWWGLTIGLNPGLIYASTAVTSEPVGVAVLLVGLRLWLRDRTTVAAVVIAALCFIKEPFLMVPVGLAAFDLVRWMTGRKRSDLLHRIALLAVGPVLFSGWYLYLRITFGRWPFTEQEGFFQFPFSGWLASIKQMSDIAVGPFVESQLAAPAVAFITVVGGLLIVGFAAASRFRSPIHAVYFPLALIVAALTPLGVAYPKDLIREVAAPVALVPFVLASGVGALRRGAGLDHDDVAQPAEGQARVDDLRDTERGSP